MGIGLPQLTFTELVGQYEAIICLVAMPNAQVSSMLPGVIQLAAQEMTDPGTHPVAFLFGRHTDAHIAGLPWFFNEDYNEAIVGIPYVSLSASAGGDPLVPLYYLPRLYLDKVWSVAGGVWWWGFEKELAQFNISGNHYSVETLFTSQPLMSLETTAVGPLGALPDFPNLFPVADMISQPLLTKPLLGLGPWSTSTFDWHWNEAEVWSAEATMTIYNAFLPGLTTGDTAFPSIENTHLGAFGIRTHWTLSLPYSPSLLTSMSSSLRTIAVR